MNIFSFSNSSGATGVATLTAKGEVHGDAVVERRPRWIITIVALLLAVIMLLFVVDRLFDPQQFRIKAIEVHGRFNHVDGAQVKQIVETALVGNYFSVSLHRLENEITQIPWVFSASLRRQWPSTIVVQVVEVQPMARWGNDKWLNFTGDLVDRQDGGQEDVEALPVLSGPDNQKQIVWKAFQQWSERFDSSGLSLEKLHLDSRGLWWLTLSLGTLALNNDQSNQAFPSSGQTSIDRQSVIMVVDKMHSFFRIQRFIAALNQQLIAQFPQMQTIDLRYPNGFAISWRGSQAQTQHIAKSEG